MSVWSTLSDSHLAELLDTFLYKCDKLHCEFNDCFVILGYSVRGNCFSLNIFYYFPGQVAAVAVLPCDRVINAWWITYFLSIRRYDF